MLRSGTHEGTCEGDGVWKAVAAEYFGSFLREQRSVLIGPQGRRVQQIKAETGLQTLLLTREAETEVYFGEAYAQVHLAGKPDSTRRALSAIDSLVGGRLAEDGFEELLRGV